MTDRKKPAEGEVALPPHAKEEPGKVVLSPTFTRIAAHTKHWDPYPQDRYWTKPLDPFAP